MNKLKRKKLIEFSYSTGFFNNSLNLYVNNSLWKNFRIHIAIKALRKYIITNFQIK